MRIQIIIGQLLRIGVFTSIGIAFLGGVIYLSRHGHEVVDYATFKGIPDYVKPANLFTSVFELRGRAIIQVGIMLLIATPVVRLIFSAIGFAAEKDYRYAAITVLVLGIIIFSMLSGKAG
ncbi:DUF1634 domain-containing protein [Mucilaginibacter sp. UR6-1]|uniref:DUF1634 domain-containing protein n=1 Tax=Mucilaginibacter sp. UR6-1 TaxID=1435643 RepID=UPI001E617E35|nr:DUF1634 domain-containing protein [Mucilaginibacter sp. UR6-1]MCC8409736.1 DUF1634 domain-containing protein [Mucilaginibacter sp. UR6-1]